MIIMHHQKHIDIIQIVHCSHNTIFIYKFRHDIIIIDQVVLELYLYSRLRGVIAQRADIFNASITNSNFAAS